MATFYRKWGLICGNAQQSKCSHCTQLYKHQTHCTVKPNTPKMLVGTPHGRGHIAICQDHCCNQAKKKTPKETAENETGE